MQSCLVALRDREKHLLVLRPRRLTGMGGSRKIWKLVSYPGFKKWRFSPCGRVDRLTEWTAFYLEVLSLNRIDQTMFS